MANPLNVLFAVKSVKLGNLIAELSPSTSPDACDNTKLPQLENERAGSDGEGYGEDLDEYGFDPSLHVFHPDAVQVSVTDTDDGIISLILSHIVLISVNHCCNIYSSSQ